MAHVGKFYKLQFRRDLANVLNNVNAYPEAMLWDQSNLGGPLGIDVRDHQPILINLAKDNQPPMVWESVVRHAGGIDYTVRLTINDPFNIPASTLRVQVLDANTAATYFNWVQQLKSPSSTPSGWSGVSFAAFIDTPQYKILGGSFLWDWRAAAWSVYNP